jgi:hypothetical protein
MKRLIFFLLLLFFLVGCEEDTSKMSCYLNYLDKGINQRVHVSKDTFYDVVEKPNGSYIGYYSDDTYEQPTDVDSCTDDIDLYVEITYLEFTTIVYDLETYTVIVEDIYRTDHNTILYVADNHIFMELWSNDLENPMIDVTEYFSFNEEEWIQEVISINGKILIYTTEDRLFAVDALIRDTSYFEEGINVQFISENVKQVFGSFDEFIFLTYNNNVYRASFGNDNTSVKIHQENMKEHFEGSVTDMFNLQSQLYFVTEANDLYFCSRLLITDEESLLQEDFVCDQVVSDIPFELLYQSLQQNELDIHYDNQVYYLNQENVYLHDRYINPLNETEEILYAFYNFVEILITTEHVYVFDLDAMSYLDIRDVISLNEGETIILANMLQVVDDGAMVFLTNQGRILMSNEIDLFSPSQITSFTNLMDRITLDEVHQNVIDDANIIGLNVSGLFIQLVYDNGVIIKLNLNEMYQQVNTTVLVPTFLDKESFTYTLENDLESVFGPTYNEQNLFLDPFFLEPIDFDSMVERPSQYDILFYQDTE